MTSTTAADSDLERGTSHNANPSKSKPGDDTQDFKPPPGMTYNDYLPVFQLLIGISTPDNILDAEGAALNAMTPAYSRIQQARHDHSNNNVRLPMQQPTQPKRGPQINPRQQLSFRRFLFTRATINSGCYGNAINQEFQARIAFQLSKHFINFVCILQILVAAVITALSTYRQYHVPLTVFGALNTVLAGLIALMKGQGLPNRMLKARDAYSDIIQQIEDSERLFASYRYVRGDIRNAKNPWDEAERLEKLFSAARKDQQDNYPDLYINNHERAAMNTLDESNQEGSLFGKRPLVQLKPQSSAQNNSNGAQPSSSSPSSPPPQHDSIAPVPAQGSSA